MRGWITLALALAVVAVPAAAQYGSDTHMGGHSTSSAAITPMPPDMTFQQGAFVGHHDRTSQAPESVTLRYNWQGMPLLVTYHVTDDQQWMSLGRRVSWRDITEGRMVTVPTGARVVNVAFAGTVGAGTVVAIDQQQRTVTVRLPSGETRILRVAPGYLLYTGHQLVPGGQVALGETVVFEVPPRSNQVALFTDIGPPTQGVVTEVDQRSITVRFMRGGQQVTETFGVDSDTRFYQRGQLVAVRDIDRSFRQNDTVWVFGTPDNPQVVVANPTVGFEVAVIESTGPVVAEVPVTQPGVVTPEEPSVVVTPEQPEVATIPEEPATAVAGFRAMQAPFAQGQVISFVPAAGDMPAMVTVQFDWQGTPLLGTFQVSDQQQWVSQGRAVDFTQIQAGTTIMVPENARLVNLTFGGPVGVGTVTSIDRARNRVTVRLPTGEMRTLRISPRSVFLEDGRPMAVADIAPGQTIMFEVVPQGNMVGLFTALPAGMRGTVTQVTDNSITVRFMHDGQMLTHTFPLTDQTRFFFRGQQVTEANFGSSFVVGQPVFIFGPIDQPQFIAGGVQAGFEVAVIQPAPRAGSAVAGVREQPRPARRVIRGRW